MISKKVLVGLLSVSILSLNTATAFAANNENMKPVNNVMPIMEIMPIKAEPKEAVQFKFASFTGKVKAITPFEGNADKKFVLVENAEGAEANIVISKDTYIVENAEITVGSEITGYFNGNAPMILIYPAQYNAEVVAVESKDRNIKVDIFNEDLVSADNSLKLNISNATEIVAKDGTAYKGELKNRKLAVIYGASTRSIPAQTNPVKVVVLSEKEETAAVDVAAMDIVVNGKKIQAAAAFSNENGVVMVPLRAIGEASGYEVTWNNQEQSAMLGKGITLKIGNDNYIYMKTAPIKLATAPVVVEGKTYVPLSFFSEVARFNNAEISNSQIIINSEALEK